MKFEYWGSWGYKKHAVAAINEIEKTMPNKFQYLLCMDSGKTGRLEVNIHMKEDCSDDAVMVFSKLASKCFPMKDDETKDLFI